MDEILYQIMLIVTIIAIVALIAVFIRLYLVLTDVNDTTRIAKKRARELDAKLGEFSSLTNGILEIFKGIAASMQTVSNIEKKITSFFNNKTKIDKRKENNG